MSTESDNQSLSALAIRLFVPQERLGWEFVEPQPETPHPDAEPTWLEPAPPDPRRLRERLRQSEDRLVLPGLGMVLAVAVGVAQFPSVVGFGALLAAGLIGVIWLPPMFSARSAISEQQQTATDQRAVRHAGFRRAHEAWQKAVEEHERAERERLAQARHWFPVDISTGVDRIDVFGGSAGGRAALLATLGPSLIGSGHRLTVLDLTEEAIALPLTVLFHAYGATSTTVQLPEQLDTVDLLANLHIEEIAELLSGALLPHRREEGVNERRDRIADVLLAALRQLRRPVTLPALVAALQVLNSVYDVRTETILTDDEVAALVETAHDLGAGERVREDVSFAIGRLQLLVPDNVSDRRQPFAPLHSTGLTVYATSSDRHRRRKELLDQILVSLTVGALRRGSRDNAAPVVLVVAGADRVDPATLDAITLQARRNRTRLILMFDHLRDEARRLLGEPRSAAVLMQLGNSEEAAAAAAFIGRGHRFVLSQVSRQQGTTRTVGGGTSTTEQHSTGMSDTTSSGVSRQGFQGGSNQGTSTTQTESMSTSRSSNSSWSLADSTTDGEVVSRVYEFAVEPTEIQALPATAFVLVDNVEGARRVTTGNCDPRITELPRLSDLPRHRAAGEEQPSWAS